MNLVIVESPTKARTISRFLSKDYDIKFSMGHVMDLPKSKLGVDIENGFEPQYEVIDDKKKIIAELKKAAKSAKQIILATDPDREGEAIAAHVAQILTMDNRRWNLPSIKRIVFHEITKEAVEEAFKTPRSIDNHLVDAQTARRVLDRLVGYKLSPLLWRKVRRGLSAGRVQSVALRLIVEREREIDKFGKEEYWTIMVALLQKDNKSVILGTSEARTPESLRVLHDKGDSGQAVRRPELTAEWARMTTKEKRTEFELIEINGKKIELQSSLKLYDGEYKVTKTIIDKELEAQKIVDDLKTKQYTVSSVIKKEMQRSPQPPYTTSTLQQDASRKLGFNGKRTMGLAQKLYEEGYITYHRTDSISVSFSFQKGSRDFIKKEYGDKYIPEKPRFYKTRQKLAQEAHEAIRPTRTDGIQNSKFKIQNELGNSYWKLYELIWRRAVGSQMADAVIESTTVFATTNKQQLTINKELAVGSQKLEVNEYRLKANGSVLIFDGFLKVNPQALQDNELPKFTTGERLNLIDIKKEQHQTQPPPRYNDASLIKTLEEKGIGRPSTYATIISTIEGRSYIEREQSRFLPTPIGVAVNDFLTKNFSDIDDIPFTALMEDELDSIANGEKKWAPMIKNFYLPFEKKLEDVGGAERVKIAVEETSEKCPECKKANLVIRTGKFGKFLSCSRFPECKFTKPFVETTDFTCPKDSAQIVIKKTRKGRRFYGCSNYPACTFAAWNLADIKGNFLFEKFGLNA